MAPANTAFERIKAWWQNDAKSPIELKQPNPLKALIGNRIQIQRRRDGAEGGVVEAIAVMDCGVPGQHPVVDYALAADGRRVILRVPLVERCWWSSLLFMEPFYPEDGEPYPWGAESQPLLDSLMDPSGEFRRYQETPWEERYVREISNQHGTATLLQDADGDSHDGAKEVRMEPFSFWTFRRTVWETPGGEFEQHLHAYLSGAYDPQTLKVAGGDRTLIIHRGVEIPAGHAVVYDE